MLALLGEIGYMLNIAPVNNFAAQLTAITLVLLVSGLWYFLYVYKPYAKFPACRLEHRIPLWILKRMQLNHAVLQTFIQQSRRYESEGVFAVWLGVPFLIVYGEEIVKKIVREPTATDKTRNYKLFESTIGKCILTSNGEAYKKQWKMCSPAFNIAALKTYTTTMNKHSEDLTKRLSELDGQPTDDIINMVAVCAMGVIDETNFGNKEKTVETYIKVIKVFNRTTEFLIKRLWSPWLYFEFALQFSSLAKEASELIKNIVRDSLKPRLENIKEFLLTRPLSNSASAPDDGMTGRRLKPLGESFLEQHLQDPTITMDDVAQQLLIVIGAGFDTVTLSVTYALHLLGLHQDVQDRAFEEVMSETEGHITYDDLQRMVYLECVIKETVRLYPAVPLFGRQLKKELQCGEYKLPKNASAFVFPYMLHRNPEIYPNPEKFDPERFLDKNSKIRPWNFIPFAEGLRPCIGKNYAMVLMKIILAHVLRNFRIISLGRMEERDLSWSAVLNCTKKLPIQFLPRSIFNEF